MKLAITGTPGIGKTSVAKLLSKVTNYSIINLNYLLLKNFKIQKDENRDTWEVDIERAIKEIELPKNCILEGHLSHFFPVDAIIVLRCKPKQLLKRLRVKKWFATKVEENTESEALNLISEEAREQHQKVFDLDTSNLKPIEVAEKIQKLMTKWESNKTLDFLKNL